jgi:hypothetical protein
MRKKEDPGTEERTHSERLALIARRTALQAAYVPLIDQSREIRANDRAGQLDTLLTEQRQMLTEMHELDAQIQAQRRVERTAPLKRALHQEYTQMLREYFLALHRTIEAQEALDDVIARAQQQCGPQHDLPIPHGGASLRGHASAVASVLRMLQEGQ